MKRKVISTRPITTSCRVESSISIVNDTAMRREIRTCAAGVTKARATLCESLVVQWLSVHALSPKGTKRAVGSMTFWKK